MPAAPVGAAGGADALDCSRRLSGTQRSPVGSPATPAEGSQLLGLLLRPPGRVPRRCLEGRPAQGRVQHQSHLSHLDMPVSPADWPTRVGVLHAESRSILMGTLLDFFQSYGATRSCSPVPQAAVSGKRDSSSVDDVWTILIFHLEKIHQKSSVKPESLPHLHKHHFSTQSYIYSLGF